jgi:hypothetical protein
MAAAVRKFRRVTGLLMIAEDLIADFGGEKLSRGLCALKSQTIHDPRSMIHHFAMMDHGTWIMDQLRLEDTTYQ